MREYFYRLGHKAGETMTVAELREKLADYPDDMPVFAEWEGCWGYVTPAGFSVTEESKTIEPDEAKLIIWVEDY